MINVRKSTQDELDPWSWCQKGCKGWSEQVVVLLKIFWTFFTAQQKVNWETKPDNVGVWVLGLNITHDLCVGTDKLVPVSRVVAGRGMMNR